MTSQEIRNAFLSYFNNKEHQIVPSAPMVLKNDPTLMFTNAGMNPFKDIFLGNRKPPSRRVADTQKCLRVTGKHNDLSEVGHDTYHHTMFEMLGNWSFGDYFKEEAISWAWEFLTARMGIDPERVYATVFEGDPADGTDRDEESRTLWGRYLPAERILDGSKKDNFWEMGETGPCGPCSEIHLDLRPDAERKTVPGADLVNRDHPRVIEIWNLVFIQHNRKASGELENLPERHVDTGMGFERLCMALQGKESNYDTDLFRPLIAGVEEISGRRYGEEEKTDVAMRVVADHLRAVAFSIADGQLPSNNKAGYVIRRILRRAVRYGFTYLGQAEPFIHRLVPSLVEIMSGPFPELEQQQELIGRVIREEEHSFLATLETGMKLLEQLEKEARRARSAEIPGNKAFELYDTFGFPLDLTELILEEKGLTVDREGFAREMEAQKNRSKKAAETRSGDWVEVSPTDGSVEERSSADGSKDEDPFLGYDRLEAEVRITRYRKVDSKKGSLYHLVFDVTPFYAESGGQIGDRGILRSGEEQVEILDTRKENELIIHLTRKLPSDPSTPYIARVNEGRRVRTANNHTATHLMHHALREVLGDHVEQKGSLVEPGGLRFDFSHFQKMTGEEIRRVEQRVNQMIRQNLPQEEHRSMPMDEAREMGAMALFGEKYGDRVRVIRFGETVELCGGTHVRATGQIGLFKILRESSIAAGIRRIEAITGGEAEEFLYRQTDLVSGISEVLENPKDPLKAVTRLSEEHARLSKEVEQFRRRQLGEIARQLEAEAEEAGGMKLICRQMEVDDPSHLRDLSFNLRAKDPRMVLLLGAEIGGKAHLSIAFSDELVKASGLNASQLIREVSREIKGGGGGQPFFATAGGRNPAGIGAALEAAREKVLEIAG